MKQRSRNGRRVFGTDRPFVDYLTGWNYHIPGGTQASFDSTGNAYYAYLEVNTITGAATTFDGDTCSIATTHPKYLVYPGQNAVQSRVNRAAGTIDPYVPLSDVGNPPLGASLYKRHRTHGEPSRDGRAGQLLEARSERQQPRPDGGDLQRLRQESGLHDSPHNADQTSNGCEQTQDTKQAEANFVTLINQHRAAVGLSALTVNSTLSSGAREHSCDMEERNNLSETGSDGSTPENRISAAGVPFAIFGENVGTAPNPLPLPAVSIIDSQIFATPAYQANILNPAFTQIGAGVVYVNGQEWVTEDFVG